MKILFGICGSFCCHEDSLKALDELCALGHSVTPVLSENAANFETRFGASGSILEKAKKLCEKSPLLSIPSVEKTVTSGDFDIMVVCPCTGNTLSKIANGITDGAVTMGVKAMLRNKKPVVIAFASNDGLAGSLKNIAMLAERKNFFFVPLRQDDYINKPTSLVCNFSLVEKTVSTAILGKQLQPFILAPLKKE
jgi:dipicolinate synthase subunit B